MLAAKRSFGSLRAVARAQPPAPAPSTPALPSLYSSPQQQQRRTLVSAVLLSRAQFETKSVKQLQAELGERGLSTKGRKSVLVDRLLEAASRGAPAPALSTSSPASTSTLSAASFSTSAKSNAGGSGSGSKKGISQQTEQKQDSELSDPAVTGDSVAVSSGSATEVHTPTPAPSPSSSSSTGTSSTGETASTVTAAPGIVVPKEEEAKLAEAAEEVPGGGIDMPGSVALSSDGQQVFLPSVGQGSMPSAPDIMIPSPPDQYRTPADYDPYHQPFTMHPSWITVAASGSTQVHHTGSNHHVTDDPDSRTSEPQKEFSYDSGASFASDLLTDLGLRAQRSVSSTASAASSEAQQQTSALLTFLQEQTGVKLPPLSQPLDKKKRAEEFKFQDRDLDAHERSGLFALAGLLGTGLLLGGLGNRSRKAQQDAHKQDKELKKH